MKIWSELPDSKTYSFSQFATKSIQDGGEFLSLYVVANCYCLQKQAFEGLFG